TNALARVRAATVVITRAKASAGQHLATLPAPGWTNRNGRGPSKPVAASVRLPRAASDSLTKIGAHHCPPDAPIDFSRCSHTGTPGTTEGATPGAGTHSVRRRTKTGSRAPNQHTTRSTAGR